MAGSVPARDGSAPIAPVAVAAVVMMAVLGGATVSLQPALLGGLAGAGRLTIGQMGYAATLEALAMALASAVAGARLAPERLRLIARLAAATALAANFVSIFASGHGVLLIRLLAGFSAGTIMFIYVGMMARVPQPARVAAFYGVGQGCLALLLSSLILAVLVPWAGGGAGYGAMCGINLAMLGLSFLVPTHYDRITGRSGGRLLPTRLGLAALAVVVLHFAAIMALWIYSVPLAVRAGLTTVEAGFVLSLAFGFKVAGGLCSAALAPRMKLMPTLIGGFVATFAAIVMIALGLPLFYIAGLTLFTFLWMVTTPFHMGLALAADPRKGAAMQMVTAQLAGVSLGPVVASLAVGRAGPEGAMAASVALLAAAIALALLVGLLAARRTGAAPAATAAITQ